jgi:hypothetical protein
MGGRTVISPTARGWRIRRRWRGQFPPDKTPIHALMHRRWLVEATCLGIPRSDGCGRSRADTRAFGWSRRSLRRWPVTTPAFSPGTPNSSSTCRHPGGRLPDEPWSHAARRCPGRSPSSFARMLESAMEVIWDLLVFLALVAVGLIVLNLLARRR